MKSKSSKKQFENKKSYFNYQIFETYEAGIVLNGLEIKAVRAGKINLSTSYAKVINDEIFWLGGNIGVVVGDQQRTRKLLLNTAEIERIQGKINQDRKVLIPIKLYIKRGKAKLLIGLAKGKKKFDKRESIKQRDQQRDSQIIAKI